MKRSLTTKILILSSMFHYADAHAQQWLGRTNGNYSGTYGIYTNPSSISDSKYKFYFNFWGRGVNFYNNYLSYNAPVKLNHWANNHPDMVQYRDAGDKVMFGNDWLLENLNGKNKQFSFTQDIWGPAIMFPVSRHWNLSVNTRQRSGMQMFGISEEAAVMAKNGIADGRTATINNKFSANILSMQELSFTLGGILAQNERNKLHGGATIKMIRGLGAAYLKGDQLSIRGTGTNSALVNGNVDYAYTDHMSAINPFNDPYGLFSLTSRGAGAGFDLGLSYTYRSEPLKHRSKWDCNRNDKKSDYDFKLSVALTDIGGVRFDRNSTRYNFGNTLNTPVAVPSTVLDGFHSPRGNAFDTIGKQVFGTLGAAATSGFSTSLPAAVNVQTDFRWSKNFYTALYWNQSLKGNGSAGLRSTSMLSIIPRFESRGFEFSMPLTLSENYRNFYVGMYTRIGPVFFGSDNLGGLLNVAASSNFTGADIYGGISFGIGHCASWWYKDQVDPVYIDTMQHDTLKTELIDSFIQSDTLFIRDTVEVSRVDTVYIDKKSKTILKRDTVYIEKVITKPVEDPKKEAELKKKEEELKRKQAELEAREKELSDRDKRPTENVGLQDCINRNNRLETENRNLKNNVNNQADEIDRLNRQITELKKQNSDWEIENRKCAEERIKTNAEIIRLQEEIKNANRKIASLENEVAVLKKAQSSWTTPEVTKGTDAEKLAKANKQIDSLKLRVMYLEGDLDLCKKNLTQNDAEILKKENERKKAENNAAIAKKQADSLAYILTQRTLELEACKKNSTRNDAEILKKAELDKAKAENDAKIAKKQADSLAYILSQRTLELEACKKNGSQNDAEIQKLKQCEETNTMLKAEMQEMSKTIGRLNTKNYALSLRVDSLMNELKNCCSKCETGGNSGDAELLKQCQAGKAALEAEVLKLKSQLGSAQKSLDSMKSVSSAQAKKEVELNAEIVRLKKDLDEKAGGDADCDALKKEIETKNAEIEKLKSEQVKLQNQVKTLNAQMNEYKTEYAFMVTQNQKCNAQLDSCKRGLFNTKPVEPDGGKHEDSGGNPGSGGPHEGSNDNGSDDVYSGSRPKSGSTLSKVLDVMIQAGSKSGGSSSSGGTVQPAKKKTVSGTRPTESTGSGSTTNKSKNGGDRAGSGNGSSNTGNTGTSGNTGGSGTGAGSGSSSGSRAGGASDASGARR